MLRPPQLQFEERYRCGAAIASLDEKYLFELTTIDLSTIGSEEVAAFHKVGIGL